MRNLMRALAATAFVALTVSAFATPPVPRKSPEFTVTAPAGKPILLSSLKGKIVGKLQASQFRPIIEGAVGEFDHAILLRQFVGENEGSEAAQHWRAGWFRLYEHKKDGYPVLSYVSQWDSPESARTYFELYQRVLKGKWKKMEIASATPTEVSGTGDSGRFTIRLSGTSVQSIEGLR